MGVDKFWCFIPVGGQGKRLRPLTHDVSKPCVRFLNRPLIEFSIVELAERGVRNFIFGEYGYTNYVNLFDQYGEGVGVSAKYRIKPRLHIKHQPNLDDLGSAHSFWLNVEYYDIQETVLVVQGDSLFRINLEDLARKHEEMEAMMTIALVEVENTEQYGVADLEENMQIKRFIEKPSPGEAPSNLASAGIYVISPEMRKVLGGREIRKIMDERKRLDFGYDLIPHLIDNGYPVYGYPINIWYDVGTPERYLKAMMDVLHGKLDIRVAEKKTLPNRNIWVQGSSIEAVKRRNELVKKYKEGKLFMEDVALIGKYTRIGDFSRVSESSIDHYCVLGEQTYVHRSAIMDGCKIGSHAHILDSIVGRKTVIESSLDNPTYVENDSVIGNTVIIKEGCRLIGTRVNPGLVIPKGRTYIDKVLGSYQDIVHLST